MKCSHFGWRWGGNRSTDETGVDFRPDSYLSSLGICGCVALTGLSLSCPVYQVGIKSPTLQLLAVSSSVMGMQHSAQSRCLKGKNYCCYYKWQAVRRGWVHFLL